MADISGKGLIESLTRTRLATWTVMAFERLWPLALPLLLVIGLYLATAWFAIFRVVPDSARIAIGILFAIAALAALVPLGRMRFPKTAELDRRIERTNALLHEPVTIQTERLATASDDPFARALWEEHRRRMAEKLNGLGAGLPRTGVPSRDPWGLRAAVALLAFVAFGWSFGPSGGRIADPLSAHSTIAAIPPRVDAWVTPPPYTGRAPIFLTSDANRQQTAFTVPEGSGVTLRIIGGSGDEQLEFANAGGTTIPVQDSASKQAADKKPAPGGPREFQFTLTENGSLALGPATGRMAEWKFTVLADQPPEIALAGEPDRAINGTLGLNYTIKDDYGAASGNASFKLLDKGGTKPRALFEGPEMPLSVPRKGANPPAAKTNRDLTEHPWAGLPVELTLKAVDAAGQEGVSKPHPMRLPERLFTNPLAKAVVEQRRILALDANRVGDILEMIDAIALRPEDTIKNATHYIALTSIRTRLSLASNDDALRDVVAYMWQVARGIEDGDLATAEGRLRQAEEALKKALEEGASDKEIERLMSELREAMNEYLRELAERAMENNQFAEMPPNSQQLSQRDLQKMLDQIEEMAKSGARDKAQEMLSQLQEMMNNLRMARPQQGQQGGQQGAMRQQMDKLGELMRRQQELMNETFRLDQLQRGMQQRGEGQQQEGMEQQPGNGQEGQQGQNGEQQGQQGQNGQGMQGENGQGQGQGGMTMDELADALRQLEDAQRALQGELGQLQQDLEGLGLEPNQDFSDAGRAMGRAGDNLGEAEGEGAVGEQTNALDALRRGAQNMMQQMQQAMQGQEGGSEDGGRTTRPDDRDPLGRPRATNGPDFGESVKVPDEIDVQRAREILDAIRKRLGDALSPQIEKDYLERLLQMR